MPVGILLAAGAGARMGRPKALVRDADGTSWLLRAVASLLDGGCSPVLAVLGAEAEAAAEILDEAVRRGDPAVRGDVRRVVALDWRKGMGASLRAGLTHALGLETSGPPPTTACLTLVDLPDVDGRVVRRVVDAAGEDAAALARAAYAGSPGHPVVIGRNHWLFVIEQASGDRGARDYLASRPVALVECGDLATGTDIDSGETSP